MNLYDYQIISNRFKNLYKEISSAIESDNTTFVTNSMVSNDEILNMLNRCLISEPEVFWLCCEITVTHKFIGKEVKIQEIVHLIDRNRMRDELEVAIDVILSCETLVKCKNDYEKLKYIYTFLQQNTEYDYSSLKKDVPISHTAYGALVKKISVCDGNAKAAALLCQRLNIPYVGVCGYCCGEGHGWLMVQVEGNWYHMDPTFRYSNGDNQIFDYFLQSDKEIADTHVWNKNEYPHCSCKYKFDFEVNNISNATVQIKRKNVINTNAIKVESLSDYQRIISSILHSDKCEVDLIFEHSFGSVKIENLMKLFEKIALSGIMESIKYTYEFDNLNRNLIIRWE